MLTAATTTPPVENTSQWFDLPEGYSVTSAGRKFLTLHHGQQVGMPHRRKSDALRAAQSDATHRR